MFRQYIGLSLSDALKMAEDSGFKPRVERYETKRSEEEKDRDIVVRAKLKDDVLVLTVCGFKTKV